MAIEVAGALWAGILARSFALIAFGSDSLIELLSAFVVVGYLRKDSGGSTQLGQLSARFTSYLLLALVPTIAILSSYSYFIAGSIPETNYLGIAIAAGAVVIMPILWLEKRRIGQETNCLPLSIDALSSATCFLMSIALLGGLLMEFFLRVAWADYIATLVILLFVAREAVQSFREAHGEARQQRNN